MRRIFRFELTRSDGVAFHVGYTRISKAFCDRLLSHCCGCLGVIILVSDLDIMTGPCICIYIIILHQQPNPLHTTSAQAAIRPFHAAFAIPAAGTQAPGLVSLPPDKSFLGQLRGLHPSS